ncbi:MAG: ATP synthase F1 subunit delta [Planctomycetota bacterium]|jgi:F-type H+-transporting ATPase subunit delta
MSILNQRYAAAIFEVATKAGVVDQMGADLRKIHETLESAGMRALVVSPETTATRRRQVLMKIVEDGHQLTQNLIGVVLQRRREALLCDLCPAYEELVRQARGEVLGVVETAKPMDTLQHKQVEETASRLTGKKATLSVTENPDLIGGVRIYVGNTLYDGSMATALEQLERQLMETPLP